jgi:hypothetical protein
MLPPSYIKLGKGHFGAPNRDIDTQEVDGCRESPFAHTREAIGACSRHGCVRLAASDDADS